MVWPSVIPPFPSEMTSLRSVIPSVIQSLIKEVLAKFLKIELQGEFLRPRQEDKIALTGIVTTDI